MSVSSYPSARRRLSCLGLGRQIAIPPILGELHALIPSYSNGQGSGMIRLVCKSSLLGGDRFGKEILRVESFTFTAACCFGGACGLTARDGLEFTQGNWLRADKLKESVDEGAVAELVLGVVVDILRHVRIELLQRIGVGRVTSAESGEFADLGSSELGVLQLATRDRSRSFRPPTRISGSRHRPRSGLMRRRAARILSSCGKRRSCQRTGLQETAPVRATKFGHPSLLQNVS
jgi:hypothetical protein